MRRAHPLRPLDAVGLALVAVWLVWVVVSAVLNDRPVVLASTYVVAPLVVVAGVAVGRLAAGSLREGRAAGWGWAEVALVVAVAALLPGVRWSMAPGPPPLAYANSNTAAATQVMVLCGLALLGPGLDRIGRAFFGVVAAAAALAAVHHGSIAGLVVAVPVVVLLVAMLVRPARRVWWAVTLGVGSLGAAVVALLALSTRESWPAVVTRVLSSVRQDLWDAALGLWLDHPLVGAGPGAFQEVNPFGADPDLAAAHSSLLQVGSEMGLVGVVLVGLLVLAGYAVATGGSAAAGVLAAAAWTALWIHSLIDHLFDYPGLALLAGLVVGWAGAGRVARGSERVETSRPRTARYRPASVSSSPAAGAPRPEDAS